MTTRQQTIDALAVALALRIKISPKVAVAAIRPQAGVYLLLNQNYARRS